MMLEAVAAFLETEAVGEVGRSIFVNFIPDDVAGILVREPFAGVPYSHDLPGYFKGSFMLISRARGYEQSLALTNAAVAALKNIRAQTVNDIKFHFVRPRALPFAYAPSPGQNNEHHTTMDVIFVDTTA